MAANKCREKTGWTVEDLAAGRQKYLYGQLWEQLKPILLGTAGAGMALRGGKGIYNTLKRNVSPPEGTQPTMNVVSLPVRQKEKVAGIGSWLAGAGAETVQQLPLNIPAKTLAAGGGLWGGYKLTDWLLDKKRKADIEAELASAKQEYEAALTGQAKKAADGSLAKDLDLLADQLEKQAFLGETAGAAITGMGALSLLSALAGYSQGKARSKRKILEDAKKRQQQEQPPQPVFIQPYSV